MDFEIGEKSTGSSGIFERISSDEFSERALGILEKDKNQIFVRYRNLAKSIFLIPHAYISMAPKGSADLRIDIEGKIVEVPRKNSFCGCVLEHAEILVVQNATEDARFRENPMVRDKMHVRFYAGVPLKGETGEPFGTICVMDTIPRTFDEGRLTILEDIGSQIVAHLELEVRKEILEERLSGSIEVSRLNPRKQSTPTLVETSASTREVPICLDYTVEKVFDLFSEEANAKGVELVSNIPKDIVVTFDQFAIGTILQTTVFNGIKYCIFGGSVKVDAWKSARHLVVSVSDTGPGMPIDKVQRILEKDSAVSGLAVCRRLLETNQGQMDILTEKGMGTTITLTFPLS